MRLSWDFQQLAAKMTSGEDTRCEAVEHCAQRHGDLVLVKIVPAYQVGPPGTDRFGRDRRNDVPKTIVCARGQNLGRRSTCSRRGEGCTGAADLEEVHRIRIRV